MHSSPTIWPVCQPRHFPACGHLCLWGAALRKERTVKREAREYTRGMGYALPRPVRRWLNGKILGLREPLKLAIIRLANLVGRYHTGPKVGGRDFCLARQPKRKGRELDSGILTNPEMVGVSEHYFRLARQHLIQWGFLAIARPSERAFKSKRLSHHAPSGWRCPATLYKIGAKFAPALLWRAKSRVVQALVRRSVSPVNRQEHFRLNGSPPRSGFHTGDRRHRHDPGERSRAALEAALDRFQTAFRASAPSS